MAPGGTSLVLDKQPEIVSLFSSQVFLHGHIASYLSESIDHTHHLLTCNAGNLQKYLFLHDLSDSSESDWFGVLLFLV